MADNEVKIVITAEDKASAETAKVAAGLEKVATTAQKVDRTSGQASGGLGKLKGGLELVGRATGVNVSGMTEFIGAMEGAGTSAMGTAVAIGAVVGVFGTLAAAVKIGIDATVAYSESVRDLQYYTGLSTEETSRIIQLTDDYKIEVTDLNTAQRMLANQGLSLSVKTLADLSRQYNALGTAAQKATFLQEKFGRGGRTWAEFMKLGASAIEAQAAAQSGALIMTEAQLQAAREYEMQIDAIGDAWMGVKVQLGNAVLPAVNSVLSAFNQAIAGGAAGIFQFGPADIINAIFNPQQMSAQIETNVSQIDTQGIDISKFINWGDIAARTDWGAALGLAEGMQKEADRFATEKAKLLAQKAELDAQFANNPGAQKYQEDLAKINEALTKNAEAHKANVNAMILDVVKSNLSQGGMTPDEFQKYVELASNMGVMDEKTAAAAVSTMRLADAFVNASMPATQFLDAVNSIWALPANKVFTVSFNVNGSPQNVTANINRTPSRRGEGAADGRASGGPLFPGQSYIVGEQGAELASWTGRGWNIIPHQQTMQLMGGMAGGGTLPSSTTYNVTVNNPLAEMASNSVNRTLKNLAYLGAA